MNMQLVISIIIYCFTYLLIAYSFSVIYYPTRFFHIAHASVITFSAYFTFFFINQILLPIWLSVIFAIVLATAIGIMFNFILYSPLNKRKASPMRLMIASLGLYIILQNVISIIWGNETKSIHSGEIRIGNEIFGAYITNIQIVTIVVCLIFFILYFVLMQYSRVGKNIRAIASNSYLCNIVGIRSEKVIMISFGIGSALAALAGILVGFDKGISPTMGFNWLLYGMVTMVIGGINSNWGLIGSAILLSTVQHIGAYYLDTKWMDAIAYIILIIFLIWKPLGISGKQLKKVEI